jgi:hypothetical protein
MQDNMGGELVVLFIASLEILSLYVTCPNRGKGHHRVGLLGFGG